MESYHVEEKHRLFLICGSCKGAYPCTTDHAETLRRKVVTGWTCPSCGKRNAGLWKGAQCDLSGSRPWVCPVCGSDREIPLLICKPWSHGSRNPVFHRTYAWAWLPCPSCGSFDLPLSDIRLIIAPPPSRSPENHNRSVHQETERRSEGQMT